MTKIAMAQTADEEEVTRETVDNSSIPSACRPRRRTRVSRAITRRTVYRHSNCQFRQQGGQALEPEVLSTLKMYTSANVIQNGHNIPRRLFMSEAMFSTEGTTKPNHSKGPWRSQTIIIN
jgi:hypothetical protein